MLLRLLMFPEVLEAPEVLEVPETAEVLEALKAPEAGSRQQATMMMPGGKFPESAC